MKDLKQIMPKKLGFGCMRLPVANGNSEEIDDVVFSRMIDRYMEQGFVYFDTAYPYHNQKSEEAVRRCLVERYDRERFLLADKMPVWLVQNTEDYSEIFERQLARCGVTYFDFYLLHAMNKTRVEETEKTGGFAFVQRMKTEGRIRHIGLSSHNPVVAHMAARTGLIDVLMFSVNPCYDLLPPSDDVDTLWADESYARELHNIDPERQRLYEFCEREGIAIDVMKAYGGGDLLSDANSPFGRPMTPVQCLEYALPRPGVAAVMAGCRSRAEVAAALAWCSATAAERDYTGALAGLDKFSWEGHCMYCGHCAPCSVGIDIAGVNKYYNLTLAQHEIPETVREHYRLLPHHASACIACGRCERNCPFGVDIIGHMRLAAAKFGY